MRQRNTRTVHPLHVVLVSDRQYTRRKMVHSLLAYTQVAEPDGFPRFHAVTDHQHQRTLFYILVASDLKQLKYLINNIHFASFVKVLNFDSTMQN